MLWGTPPPPYAISVQLPSAPSRSWTRIIEQLLTTKRLTKTRADAADQWRRSEMSTSFSLCTALMAAVPRADQLPWIEEVQTPPSVIPEDAPKLSPLLVDSEGQPITSVEQWAKRREEIRRWWLDYLGPAPTDRIPWLENTGTLSRPVRDIRRRCPSPRRHCGTPGGRGRAGGYSQSLAGNQSG